MAAPNRWAVREAAEATFFDLVTGDAIVTLKTLKMTEVQTTGETVYARGGRGNAKLVGFSSNREATVSLQDAIFDNKAMAMLTGNTITAGAVNIDVVHEAIVPSTPTITLPKKVEGIHTVYILADDAITNETKLTVKTTGSADATSCVLNGQVLTFDASHEGERIKIYYKTETDASAKTVKVTSDRFGGTFKLVCDVMIRDEATKKDYFGQFIVPNAKIEDEFSFNFSPDGDPSVLDIPMEILKDPASEDMWQLVIYDDELIPAT